jgi:hypothetical protein
LRIVECELRNSKTQIGIALMNRPRYCARVAQTRLEQIPAVAYLVRVILRATVSKRRTRLNTASSESYVECPGESRRKADERTLRVIGLLIVVTYCRKESCTGANYN